jgi:RHS repeat-associated protein
MDADGLIHRFSTNGKQDICSSTHPGSQLNTYDSRHQLLTQVAASDSNFYSYDDSGNMLTWRRPYYAQDKKFEIPGGTNRMTRYWKNYGADPNYDIRITYDDDGSRGEERPHTNGVFDPTKVTYRAYGYDGLGRLKGTAHFEHGTTNTWGGEDGATEFNQNFVPLGNWCQYDPDGRQVVPCEPGAPRLGFDGDNVVRTGIDGAAAAWTFVHGPGTDDPIMGYHDNVGVVYFLTDGQGRQYAVGASNGINKTTDPYYLNSGIYAGGISNARTFLAERNGPTANAGLSFFRNRFYDRATGRWTQEDPIGIAGGLNLFAYVGNNPVTYTDPFGLCPLCIAYGAFEAGATLYDIGDLVATGISYLRGRGSGRDVALTAGGVGIGLFGVGGGYGRAARNAANSLDALSAAAGAADRGGLTKAGRALAKHGGRAGSAFAHPGGSAASLNATAQNIVDDILTNPGSTFTARHHGRFGNIVDVVDPSGRGIRYNAKGEFVHFLEPNR